MNTETMIFSQLLTNDEYSRKVIPHLKEEYFQSPQEKAFLKIYQRFFAKHNKIPSKQAIRVEIENLKQSADIYQSLNELISSTEDFHENIDFLMEKTEHFCKERAIFNALKESVLIVDGQSKTKTPDAIPTILQEALALCFDMTVGHNYYDDAESRYDYYHLSTARIKTGIKEVDTITRNGFPRKTLNSLLAPPHGGKSLVMVNIGAGALSEGYNVLYITMEMAAEEIGKRFDVNQLGVDFDTLQVLPKNAFMTKIKGLSDKSKGKLVIKEYPTGTAHAGHFRTLLSELKSKQNFVPDMIIIDYMSICASEIYKSGSNHNQYTVIGSIGKELRALAIESNTAIVTAVQTNRSGVGNQSPDMTNVSESMGVVHIVDWMSAIVSTEELKDLDQLMFVQLKNRYSNVGDMPRFLVGVDYNKMKLYSLDSGSIPSSDLNNSKKSGKSTTPPSTTQSAFDPLHRINSDTSFDDFNFTDD